MRITWVSFASIARLRGGGYYSATASARYRMLIPLRHLAARHEVQLLTLHESGEEIPPEARNTMRADAVIFSKSFHAHDAALAAEAKRAGARIVFDICDNHFEHSKYAACYAAMAEVADMVTCNTAAMAEVARQHTKAPCRIIPDPVEGVPGTPRFAPGERLKLLWFGHPSNLDSLDASIPALMRASQTCPMELTLLTALNPAIVQHAARVTKGSHQKLRVNGQEWSLAGQWKALAGADAVIIPILNNEKKSVKSSNRIVESLQAGRMALAGPLPSYEPFRPFAWIGEDMEQGIAWLLANRARLPDLIAGAQRHIAAHYAPEIIGAQWEAVLQEL